MIRRFGDAPVRGQNYRIRPGSYAILKRGARILLTHQAAPEPEFQLPGGGIDPGESPVIALRREVMEETGWTISNPVRLGAFRRFVFMPEYDQWAEKLCHIFIARPALRKSGPLEPGHSACWVSISDALALAGNPGDRHFLRTFLG